MIDEKLTVHLLHKLNKYCEEQLQTVDSDKEPYLYGSIKGAQITIKRLFSAIETGELDPEIKIAKSKNCKNRKLFIIE